MEPSDLTVRILQEIRDEVRGLRGEMNDRFDAQAGRFEVIEMTLRDLAEQLVVLARGVKSLIEQRPRNDDRLDALERRIVELERGAVR